MGCASLQGLACDRRNNRCQRGPFEWGVAPMSGARPIAGPQNIAGGASTPPASQPHRMSRTITDEVLARMEGRHAETA
jgi:hypothetical protein